ncbi:uncharacterized protein LOC110463211 [Mizuhopecten yessoensis]|uniref:Kinetochore protein SPC25 n=1 Tax=Mizuhopecten yessoensis TaxID=6573 RepID=A0A210PWN7_MIZYE|nr:uncharacterized protein LOC110463211 [Mizuhopecten yessoensis]OWF40889.1 Kinetochore protein Spc25 [Mizuhopecten yessoensis]
MCTRHQKLRCREQSAVCVGKYDWSNNWELQEKAAVLTREEALVVTKMTTVKNAEIEGLQEESIKLEEKLSSIRDKIITKWTGEEYQKLAAGLQTKHQQVIQKGQEEIKKHQGNVKRMEQLSKSNMKELQERVEKLQELKGSLLRLQEEADTLLHMKENAATQVNEESKQILKEKEYLSLQGKVTQQKLVELDKAASMFHSRLGLTFKKTTGNRLQCLFKHIDRDDPEAVFYFFIKVEGDDRRYVVSDCEPSVPELEILAEKLNKTNNLRSFIVCMRKRFQQLVQDKKSQRHSSEQAQQ